MLLKIVGHCLAYGFLHSTINFAVTQLCLCLTFELWLCHLDGDDSRESFTEVILCYLHLSLLYLLAQLVVFICIFLQRTCQGYAETGKVCTTLDGIDIIYIRMYVL